jgi:hypothetical protein
VTPAARQEQCCEASDRGGLSGSVIKWREKLIIRFYQNGGNKTDYPVLLKWREKRIIWF